MEIKLLRNQINSILTFAVRDEDKKEYLVTIGKINNIRNIESVTFRGVQLDQSNEQEDYIRNKILQAVEVEIDKIQSNLDISLGDMPEEKAEDKSFYEDLKNFKEKYPECYIECWTPEDYSSIKHDLENENIDYPETNWSDELWINVSNKLDHDFDANNGTNWDRLKYVIQNLTAK
jgi:hypothetical protein